MRQGTIAEQNTKHTKEIICLILVGDTQPISMLDLSSCAAKWIRVKEREII